MTAEELERLTHSRLEALHRELGDQVARTEVTAVGARHFERLRRHATILDYIPLLVYRSTKDELLLGPAERVDQAA